MGATGWSYVTPYDPDADEALQALRDDVFARGDYGAWTGRWRNLAHPRVLRAALANPLLLLFLALGLPLLALTALAQWLARGGRGPRSIDEALRDAAESGTHSILDITHTADIPEFGAAVPLSKAAHLRLFGTTTPTAEHLARVDPATLTDLIDSIRRWEAVYFAIHDADGRPVELHWYGCSGD